MLRGLARAVVMGLALLAAAPVAAEEVVISYEGRKLVGELTLAEGDKPRDGIMLMVHGTLAHKDMEIIQSLREQLRRGGISTLAINLSLGLSERRGMYDCARPHYHRHAEALVDIGVWLNWLQEQGVKDVWLFGHSRGGNQVAWYAFEREKVPIIKGLVLLAPMTSDPGREAAEYRQRWGKELEPLLRKAEDMVKRGRGRETLKGVDFLSCPQTEVMALGFVDYYIGDQRRDTPALLNGVQRPTLVIAGSEDALVPDLPGKLKARKLPQVTLEVIEGADHFFRDLYAEEAAERITAWLKAH